MNDLKDRIVCVDFDGTIAKYDGFKGIGVFGEPIKNVKWAMTKLKEFGATVVVHTCRREIHLVKEYMEEHKIPYDYINFSPRNEKIKASDKKLAADIYIDDRAICFFGEWHKTFLDVMNFKTWEQRAGGKAISSDTL